jgi:hypothetical protein
MYRGIVVQGSAGQSLRENAIFILRSGTQASAYATAIYCSLACGVRYCGRRAQGVHDKKGTDRVADRHSPEPATDHEQPEPHHPDLSWFLRRELVTIPLLIVITGTLLIVGVSPATLLFVALLAIVVLGFVWGPRSSE